MHITVNILQILILGLLVSLLFPLYFFIKLKLISSNKFPIFKTKVLYSISNTKVKNKKVLETPYINFRYVPDFRNNMIANIVLDVFHENEKSKDIILCDQFVFYRNSKKDDDLMVHTLIDLDDRFKKYILKNNIPFSIKTYTKIVESVKHLKICFFVPEEKFIKLKLMGFFDNLDGSET